MEYSDQALLIQPSRKENKKEYLVIKPTIRTWIIVVAVSLALQIGWFFVIKKATILVFIISGLSIALATVVWGYIGGYVTEKLIVENIEKVVGKKEKGSKIKKWLLALVGIRINTEDYYYLEYTPYTIDLNKLGEITKTKMIDVTTACLGIGFLIVTIVKPFVKDIGTAMIVSSLIVLGAPILAGLIVPMVWQLQDMRIKQLKQNHEVINIAEKTRHGALSRILGISGILAGLGFLIDTLPEIFEELEKGPALLTDIRLYLVAILVLAIVTLLIGGTATLVIVIYLAGFHEKKVKRMRKRLEKIIPVGETNAIKIRRNEEGKKQHNGIKEE